MKHYTSPAAWDDIWPTAGEPALVNHNAPVRFCITARGTSWEVCRDKAFWGIFRSRTEAHDCVNTAMQKIFMSGGAAQSRFG